jgi:cytidine deaminase
MPEPECCALPQSYCPYTRLPSGVALATASGAVYGGRYVESAAYNPSLPPLQSALAAAVIGGLPEYRQVSATCARRRRVSR